MPKFNIYRSLEEFEQSLTQRDPEARRVLGLDLGTNCGVAIADVYPASSKPVPVLLGQWDLSISDYESGPLRLLRLQTLLASTNPDLIGLEDVKFVGANPAAGVQQTLTAIVARVSKSAEFLGSLKAIATAWAESRRIPVACHGIGQIKSFATGKGNSGKLAVALAANQYFAAGFSEDEEKLLQAGEDNIADALWVCAMTIHQNFPGLFQPPLFPDKVKSRKKLD